MPPLVVRPAHPAELPTVGALTFDAYAADGFVTADDEYAATLRDASARADAAEVYVAHDGHGEVLGTVTYCPEGSAYREVAAPGEAEFRMLAVHPAARGRGVGEALVRTCMERAAEQGCRALVLSSMTTQRQAHRLYGRLGFRRTPELDWRPVPHVSLLAFRLDLPTG